MDLRSCVSCLCMFVICVSSAAYCQESLMVDFGDGEVQEDYGSFPVADVAVASVQFLSNLGTSGSVLVTVSSIDATSMEWRVRDGIDGGPFTSISHLLSDFVFEWSGSVGLELEISGLLPDIYTLTTYHHDTAYSNHGNIDIEVDDAAGTRPIASNVVQSSGYTPEEIATVTADLIVEDAGVVVIRFETVEGTGNAVILNGFDLVVEESIGVENRPWSRIKALFNY